MCCHPLGILLKEIPIWDRNLHVSLCIEVLRHDHDRTETIVIIAIPIITIEIEQTSTRAIIVIASTDTERIVKPREVRAVIV